MEPGLWRELIHIHFYASVSGVQWEDCLDQIGADLGLDPQEAGAYLELIDGGILSAFPDPELQYLVCRGAVRVCTSWPPI